MSVSTSATTPPGTYTLTISGDQRTGYSHGECHACSSQRGDFSIAATPASATIGKGGTATYSVTIAAGAGFSAAR